MLDQSWHLLDVDDQRRGGTGDGAAHHPPVDFRQQVLEAGIVELLVRLHRRNQPPPLLLGDGNALANPVDQVLGALWSVTRIDPLQLAFEGVDERYRQPRPEAGAEDQLAQQILP